jgi:acyl-CoA-binding protein
MNESLNNKFKSAYALASTTDKKLPPDIMLKLYAYYKQGTKGNNYEKPSGKVKLRNAFKLNAWLQLRHLSENEAKKEYINIVNKYLK